MKRTLVVLAAVVAGGLAGALFLAGGGTDAAPPEGPAPPAATTPPSDDGRPAGATAPYPPTCDLECGKCAKDAADPSCCRPPRVSADTAAEAARVGDVLDATLTDLDGRPLRLADLRGRVVLLNVWATWCGPCRAEIPDLVRLHERHAARGFVVVGASVDSPHDHDGADPVPVVREFVRSYGIPYPVAMAPDDLSLRIAPDGRFPIPISFLLDREGRIVKRYEGREPYEVFERDLLEVL